MIRKRNHSEYRIIKVGAREFDIRFDEPLKRYTYTKSWWSADYLAFPRNRYELVRLCQVWLIGKFLWMVLGNASNIIVRDGGIRIFVIMFDQLHTIMVNGYTIEAEAKGYPITDSCSLWAS